MTVSVTPGYGASVAAAVKANEQMQRVMVAGDRRRVAVTPGAVLLTYAAGEAVGPELDFGNALRGTLGTPGADGDTCLVERLVASVKGIAGFDADLLLYAYPLATTPVDGAAPVMTQVEAGRVQAALRLRAADFGPLAGTWSLAEAAGGARSFSGANGTTDLHGVLVARGAFTLPAPDAIELQLFTVFD
jgi:hypothetical protein